MISHVRWLISSSCEYEKLETGEFVVYITFNFSQTHVNMYILFFFDKLYVYIVDTTSISELN